MWMMFLHLLLLAAAAAAAAGIQSRRLLPRADGDATPIWTLSTEIHGGQSPLCNKTFADANATGIFTFNPNVYQGPQPGQTNTGTTQDIYLAATIQNPGFNRTGNTTASYSLWYNTGGANYSDRYALGYDVCALAGFSFNENTQLRGQEDNGTCLSAMDEPCVTAIKEFVVQWATWYSTPSPLPNSNLTSGSLPGICTSLSHQLVQNMPTECSYFFQEKLDGLAYPLTSYADVFQTGLYDDCRLNGSYQNALSFYNNASETVYDAWYHSVTPLIFVFMPIADAEAQTRIGDVVAELFCGHTNTVKEGSYEPPAAASPTPVAYNTTTDTSSNTTTIESATPDEDNSLSGGAIAGIVIGVIAALAVVAGAIYWTWRRIKTTALQAAHGRPMAEMSGQDARFELGDKDRAQLPATEAEGAKGTRGELQGDREPGELEAKVDDDPRELEAKVNNDPVELPADETIVRRSGEGNRW